MVMRLVALIEARLEERSANTQSARTGKVMPRHLEADNEELAQAKPATGTG
jgi:hypothetical protein